MTTPRTFAITMLVFAAMAFGALAIETGAKSYGVAIARAEAPISDHHEPRILLAQLDAGSGSSFAAVSASPQTTAQPAPPAASPRAADVSTILSLWKHGLLLDAGILALYLVLAFAAKLDKKHAFYITAALAGVTMLVDTVLAGSTLTINALFGAVLTVIAILTHGPLVPAPQLQPAPVRS